MKKVLSLICLLVISTGVVSARQYVQQNNLNLTREIEVQNSLDRTNFKKFELNRRFNKSLNSEKQDNNIKFDKSVNDTKYKNLDEK